MPSSQVMAKWKAGKLRSGSKQGPPVKGQKQAVAIMLHEKANEAEYGTPDKPKRGEKPKRTKS